MWWILALIAVLVLLIVVLQRRGSGSGDPNYQPEVLSDGFNGRKAAGAAGRVDARSRLPGVESPIVV